MLAHTDHSTAAYGGVNCSAESEGVACGDVEGQARKGAGTMRILSALSNVS